MATNTLATTKAIGARKSDLEEGLQDIERAAMGVERQYGSGQQLGIDPRFARAAPSQIYAAGELARRQAAVGPAFGTAGTIDERETGAQNTLAQALEKYRQATSTAGMQASQSRAMSDFEREQGLWGVGQKQEELNFNLYKSQAERDDALREAYNKGIAEEQLLQTGLENAFTMQDIETYWGMVMNDLMQDLADWKSKTESDWKAYSTELNTKASAWSKIIEGVLGGAASAYGEMA